MDYTSRFPSSAVPQVQHMSDGSHQVHSVSLSSGRSSESCASDTPIAAPPVAYYSPLQAQQDQLADFFGARRSSRSRQVVPPPYSSSVDSVGKLPTYEDTAAEPPTLARFMFLYGFCTCISQLPLSIFQLNYLTLVFPPFWLMGIVILCSELRPTQAWEMGKTEEEKVRLLAQMVCPVI